MTLLLTITGLTIFTMILAIIFFPSFTFKKRKIASYWVIALVGAQLILVCNLVTPKEAIAGFLNDGAINPLKILTLFLSFTLFSIFLDEIGFFAYLASLVASSAKHSQKTLFTSLYILTSVLTVFTANDIVILTLTPFIIYFAKNAKINPLPYLLAEFVGANTWSMLLIIGNPTNIYLATSFDIDFLSYFVTMALPTLSAGLLSYIIMRVIFRKHLRTPLEIATVIKAPDRGLMIIGLIHLGLSTIFISIASYIKVEMWLVTSSGAVSLFLISSLYLLIHHQSPSILLRVLRRAPYSLIPFMLSMTIIVIGLDKYGVPLLIATSLANMAPLFSYGFSSFFFSNIINNIPMSILYTEVLSANGGLGLSAVYATIIGSNMGAILSPIGALAGIMWMTILKKEGIRYGYGSFLRYGMVISLPILIISLIGLGFLF